MWGEMRMDPTDLGRRHGLSNLPGERPAARRQLDGPVQARREGAAALHHGSAMTIFDARIPGLRAQGRAGRRQLTSSRSMSTCSGSVSVETYDVIVELGKTAPTRSRRNRSTAAARARHPGAAPGHGGAAAGAGRAGRARCRPTWAWRHGSREDGHSRWTMPRWVTIHRVSHVPPVDARPAQRCWSTPT